jgi:hypothetical protein
VEKIKKWWNKLSFKKSVGGLWNRVAGYYTVAEGGKNRINFEKFLISGSFLMCPLLIVYFFASGENTAYVGRTPNSLTVSKSQPSPNHSPRTAPNNYNYPVQQNADVVGGAKPSGPPKGHDGGQKSVKLAAKQVLIREDANLGYGFHVGSNLIGELQSTVDTRDPNQVVRVVLPYGGKSRDGSAELPRGTLLLGQVSYQGKGEKVFIQFQQAILPEGKAIKIAAIALDPKDYSTGLGGEIQSQAKSRALSVMGLSAVAAMGNVMTEKESMGLYQVEAKASAKNALLAGVAKSAEVEAGRLQEQTEAQDYVQVDAGTAVVVSLTQGLSL